MTTELDGWPRGPAQPRLAAADVHLWCVATSEHVAELERLRSVLSPDELARAERFRFEEHRHQFILRRAALRDILGRTMALRAEAIRFDHGPHGKPRVAAQHPGGAIQFSLSHTRGLALIAVTRDREVGVDVERVDARRADQAVANRFFAPAEADALRATPRDSFVEAFFTCWTRKEAFVKATGRGLSQPLDSFVVSIRSGDVQFLEHVNGDVTEDAWESRAIAAPCGYVAALVSARPPIVLTRWRWAMERS